MPRSTSVSLHMASACTWQCHRAHKGYRACEIKPRRIFSDGQSHALKISEIGMAKCLSFGKQFALYVWLRYYRELILGSIAGCTYSGMILGQPFSAGKGGIDPLVEIITVLGTPSPETLQQ